MRTPLAISIALHTAVVAAAALGMPVWWEREIAAPAPVVIELVNISDKTVQKPAEEKEPEPEPEPEEKVAEKPVPEPPKPPEKEKEAPPPPPRRVEAAPPPPPPAPPEVKPAPEDPPPPPPPSKPQTVEKRPEPEDKPEPPPAPEQRFASVPTPMAKPVLEKPEKPEQKKFDLDKIAALLDKRQETDTSERVESRKRADNTPPAARKLSSHAQMTVSEIDAIRAQLARCWSVPAGARDVQDFTVRIRVFLNPDGSLERAPEVLDNLSGNEFYRTFAESARRAVQICSPLQGLPVEKYEQWRELTINFDPREMLRG